MKKFSKKVKSILIASIALVAVVAIVLCAVLIKKNKNGDGLPNPELNKQAQLFLDEQKAYAGAIDNLSDNRLKSLNLHFGTLLEYIRTARSAPCKLCLVIPV